MLAALFWRLEYLWTPMLCVLCSNCFCIVVQPLLYCAPTAFVLCSNCFCIVLQPLLCCAPTAFVLCFNRFCIVLQPLLYCAPTAFVLWSNRFLGSGLGSPRPPAQGFVLILSLEHAVLAALFWRLEYLWTPMLCVLCGLAPSPVVAGAVVARGAALVAGGAPDPDPGPDKDKKAKPGSAAAKVTRYAQRLLGWLGIAVLAYRGVEGSERFRAIFSGIANESMYHREVVIELMDHIRRRYACRPPPWRGGGGLPTPLQGALPMPSYCPPTAKRQLQWHL